MAASNWNDNEEKKKSYSLVTRIRELFSFNIGTIIFGAIFLYMIITIILYITAHHITSYQVTSGPLARNQTYTGMVVRDETVVTANTAGYVTYYARENSKVRKNGVVYSIGNTRQESTTTELSDAALGEMQSQMQSFSYNYNPTDFNNVYSFKSQIEGSLLQSAGLTSTSGTVTLGDQTICTAPQDGLVLYSIDGYEDYEVSQFSSSDINARSYQIQDLKTQEQVPAGEPVYKIITSEEWSLYIPLTDRQIVQLSDRTQIRVQFLKDGTTQVAQWYIHTNEDGTYYGELRFTAGMIRYANDRFLDIELVTNTQSGLKIPISSVVNKEFYTIPEDYATQGGDSDDLGFLRETKDDDGQSVTEFVHVTLYEHKDGLYYVDENDLKKGDVIIKSDSSDRFVVGNTDTLEGAYCINRGYAVFRKIVIIDKNDEFCIVETGTPYGLAQFDHIVMDSSEVNENQILY